MSEKQHDTVVSEIRVKVETGSITKYLAHCKDCGWSGSSSITKTGAEYEADDHLIAIARSTP